MHAFTTRQATLARIAITGLGASILLTCADDTESPITPVTGDVIDASGGTVQSADGGATVIFPQGAVSAPTTIEISTASSPPAGGMPGTAYTLGPDGLQFGTPVELRIRYDPDQVPAGSRPEDLVMAKLVGSGWQVVAGSEADTLEDHVWTQLSSFSTYCAMAPPTGGEIDSLTVYIVDDPPPGSADHFRELPDAMAYLAASLGAGDLGKVVVQTDRALVIQALSFVFDLRIRKDGDGGGTIQGPGAGPLIIDAAGALDLRGFAIVNDGGLVLNANRRLDLHGLDLPSTSDVNVGGVAGAPFPAGDPTLRTFLHLDRRGSGGQIAGSALGDAFSLNYDAGNDVTGAWTLSGNTGGTVGVGGVAEFGLDYHLDILDSAMGILDLEMNLSANAGIRASGNSGMSACNLDCNVAGQHDVTLESSVTAALTGRVAGVGELNLILRSMDVVNGEWSLDVSGGLFDATASQFATLGISLLAAAAGEPNYALNLATSTIREELTLTAMDNENGTLTVGLDELTVDGGFTLSAKYRGEYEFDHVTILGEANVSLHSNVTDIMASHVTYGGAFYLSGQGVGLGVSLQSDHARFQDHAFIDFPTSAQVVLRFDETILDGSGTFFISSGNLGPEGERPAGRPLVATGRPEGALQSQIVFNGVSWQRSGVDHIECAWLDVPVFISGCSITHGGGAPQAAPIYFVEYDGPITVIGNNFIGAGIKIIDCYGPIQITDNVISVTLPGSSGLWLNGYGPADIRNNDILCDTGAANGVFAASSMQHSGIATITGNRIFAGGADHAFSVWDAEVHANGNDHIAGRIWVVEGPLQLTGNTLSACQVIDQHQEGGLLNDPVEDNNGLSPDDCWTRIDWDENGCCDYPPEANLPDGEGGCENCYGVPPIGG